MHTVKIVFQSLVQMTSSHDLLKTKQKKKRKGLISFMSFKNLSEMLNFVKWPKSAIFAWHVTFFKNGYCSLCLLYNHNNKVRFLFEIFNANNKLKCGDN